MTNGAEAVVADVDSTHAVEVVEALKSNNPVLPRPPSGAAVSAGSEDRVPAVGPARGTAGAAPAVSRLHQRPGPCRSLPVRPDDYRHFQEHTGVCPTRAAGLELVRDRPSRRLPSLPGTHWSLSD